MQVIFEHYKTTQETGDAIYKTEKLFILNGISNQILVRIHGITIMKQETQSFHEDEFAICCFRP